MNLVPDFSGKFKSTLRDVERCETPYQHALSSDASIRCRMPDLVRLTTAIHCGRNLEPTTTQRPPTSQSHHRALHDTCSQSRHNMTDQLQFEPTPEPTDNPPTPICTHCDRDRDERPSMITLEVKSEKLLPLGRRFTLAIVEEAIPSKTIRDCMGKVLVFSVRSLLVSASQPDF